MQVKWFLILLLAFGLMQGIFSLAEGKFQPSVTSEDLNSLYNTHISTTTQEGVKTSIVDFSAKEEEHNIPNTFMKALTWDHAVLDTGIGPYVRQYILWPFPLSLEPYYSLHY